MGMPPHDRAGIIRLWAKSFLRNGIAQNGNTKITTDALIIRYVHEQTHSVETLFQIAKRQTIQRNFAL